MAEGQVGDKGETQNKKSSLRSPHAGQSKPVRVATEASGSPTVCLFVVDSWSCCLFIIRPPHCEDAASVRHSINNPESGRAVQEHAAPAQSHEKKKNAAGFHLSFVSFLSLCLSWKSPR